MSADSPSSDASELIDAAASKWLARKDRGLSAAEQDEYLQWLRDDPSHGQAMAQLNGTWSQLDALAEWRPQHADQPNPDLLAPRSQGWRRFNQKVAYTILAAAAAIALGIFVLRSDPTPAHETARGGVKVLPRPEHLILADGSSVELNAGGRIQTAFTEGERRVRLLRGEALFTVTKNPARPFIVEAGTVAVRAVGTAFDVRRGAGEVEVLVTEGKVHLERPPLAGKGTDMTPLVAGQRAIVDVTDSTRLPVVSTITPGAFEEALAWQAVRIEFSELPLAEVVAEFNLRNTQQMAVADAETGTLRLGGTFRTDNVEGFVRLLESSFGVKAESRSDGVIELRRNLGAK